MPTSALSSASSSPLMGTSDLFAGSPPANPRAQQQRGLHALSGALDAGNTDAAQSAVASLQAATRAVGNTSGANDAARQQVLQESLAPLSQALAGNDLGAARALYAQLQSDLNQANSGDRTAQSAAGASASLMLTREASSANSASDAVYRNPLVPQPSPATVGAASVATPPPATPPTSTLAVPQAAQSQDVSALLQAAQRYQSNSSTASAPVVSVAAAIHLRA